MQYVFLLYSGTFCMHCSFYLVSSDGLVTLPDAKESLWVLLQSWLVPVVGPRIENGIFFHFVFSERNRTWKKGFSLQSLKRPFRFPLTFIVVYDKEETDDTASILGNNNAGWSRSCWYITGVHESSYWGRAPCLSWETAAVSSIDDSPWLCSVSRTFGS